MWLIFGSIKNLEIKASIVFNLDFANNTILSCFFLFLLIIDLYFLIPAVITQIFYPTAKFTIPTGAPTEEAKLEMETHPVTVETKIIKCSI